ncbi:hypothetical protein GC163_03950 [bacterium]|nr:hypothetical protein [bacterium]
MSRLWKQLGTAALWSGCVWTAVGCGGGASVKPTVTFRPSHIEVAGTEAAPETSTSPTTAAPTEAAVAGGFGTLKGRVVIQGNFSPLPPAYEKGAAPKDPSICGVEAIPNETVVVNDGGLANVFIYLAKVPSGVEVPPPGEPLEFDQRVCVFRPHVIVVQTNQIMKVLNDDAVAHNTHTYPKRNSPFNQTVAPNDRSGVELKYGRAETQPFQVGCDIHPWMVAYHLPVDHPWATVSQADGTFEIKNVPSGKMVFKVWHEKGGELEKSLTVEVKPDAETVIEIPVAASKLARFEGPASKLIQLSSAD